MRLKLKDRVIIENETIVVRKIKEQRKEKERNWSGEERREAERSEAERRGEERSGRKIVVKNSGR